MLTRRSLFTSASLTALLAGCGGVTTGGGSSPVTNLLSPELLEDISSIIGAVRAVIPAVSNILTPDVLAKAQDLLAQATQIAQAISGGGTADMVKSFVSVVQQILPLLGVAIPPPYGTVIAAVFALLPVILAAVGVITNRASPVSAAQARAVLRPYARQRM